jgi:DNA-binding NarL/FixJ family response regulator
MRAVTVLVYSDQRMFGSALADSLDGAAFHVLGVVDRSDALRVEVGCLQPEVCAIDVADGDEGAHLFRTVRSECPGTRIVVLAGDGLARLWEAYETGLVDGAVSKSQGLDTIRTAVGRAARGERFAPAVPRPSTSPPPAVVSLTVREHQILRLLAHGATTRQILATLAISPNTLRTHVQHVLNKLHAHTRAQAVQVALTARLLLDSDEDVS